MDAKRAVSVILDAAIVEHARRLNVDVSAVATEALREAIKAKRQAWVEENAEAFAAEAAWIERNGHRFARLVLGGPSK